jgi:NAD(P)-dependent dehydrogenase (short-subunit alcohol dehydrogenase family)
MSSDIAGKIAWITGASSGLGERFSRVLATAGAVVALSARRVERLDKLAAEVVAHGGRALVVPMDATNVENIRAAAARIEAELGAIDILVNNAGISRQARIEAFSEADFDAVLDTNLKGPFFAAQAAARQMIAAKRGGRIVNIGSVAGFRTLGHQAPYSMSKAGIAMMTQCMAREWGRHGINTNAICPGYIKTEIGGDFWETEAGAKLVAALPRRRVGEPRDLDALLLLLCAGEAARFINGACMVADDGSMAF